MMDSEECCPVFDPARWDKKTFNWENERFITDSMPTLFHIPLPSSISKRLTRMWESAQRSGSNPAPEDTLVLFRDPSPFRSEIYVSVTDDVEGEKNTTLSGRFISMVFDGPYNAIPKFIREMDGYLEGMDEKAEDYLVHYAYCPKCAKERGHNYTVLFAKV